MADTTTSGGRGVTIQSRVSVILVSVAALVLVSTSLSITPRRLGDAHEYALVLEALCSHGTPDIRAEDVQRLKALVAAHPNAGYDPKHLATMRAALRAGRSHIQQFIRARSGRCYGVHFWFYPLIACPARIFLSAVRGNPLQAFQLTNALLVTVALAYVMLSSRPEWEVRLWIASLHVFAGTLFYLRWAHPEVYTAACTLVASVAFVQRRYGVAILASALGALQNPPTALLIPAALACSAFGAWSGEHSSGGAMRAAIRVATHAALASICLLPFAYSAAVIGVFSSTLGSSDTVLHTARYAPLERMASIFFDLNQGMVIGMPAVVGLVVSLVVRRVVNGFLSLGRKVPLRRSLLPPRRDVLLVWVVAMAAGTLPQPNWNSGYAVFIRYALWIGMPLLVWGVVEAHHLGMRARRWLLGATLVAQVACTFGHRGVYAMGEEYGLSPAARLVLNRFPHLYSPVPEIFTERVLGRVAEPTDLPVAFRGDDGFYKKILLTPESMSVHGVRREPRAIVVAKRTQRPVDLSKIDMRGRHWRYLSGDFTFARPSRSHNLDQVTMPLVAIMGGTGRKHQPHRVNQRTAAKR